MLPRKCKKCKCYVAPQLQRCPRCNTKAPAMKTAPTKEEKQDERAKRDTKVPLLHAKNIHWVPSAFSVQAQTALLNEQERRLAKADTARLRNTIRSEIRATKAHLAKAKVPSGKKPWTTEIFHTKQMCVSVFISPKKHRYVLAERDGPADLIVQNKKRAAVPFTRLQRFEKSRFARMKKAEKQEEVVHKKRKKAKKERRVKKVKRTKSS